MVLVVGVAVKKYILTGRRSGTEPHLFLLRIVGGRMAAVIDGGGGGDGGDGKIVI